MQNKPNFQKSQMNANLYNTTDYERKRDWTLGENKPNSNPFKPNCRRAQMNVNLTLTKDYRKKDDFAVRINKPNSKPISSKPKMSVNLYVLKDYENETAFRPQKNKPKQSQWIGNELKSPISPKLTKMSNIWNLSMFHSIISHRNTSLTSDSPMPEITKTDE